jgi:hypothetical protein
MADLLESFVVFIRHVNFPFALAYRTHPLAIPVNAMAYSMTHIITAIYDDPIFAVIRASYIFTHLSLLSNILPKHAPGMGARIIADRGLETCNTFPDSL